MGAAPKPGHTNDQLSTIFAEFLAANPLSKIKRQSFDKDGVKQAIFEKPWGDISLAIMIPDHPTALAETLNNLRLPSRFSAIWHKDTKDLEIIWTAYEVVREECFPRVIFKRSGLPRRREQGSAPERTIFV